MKNQNNKFSDSPLTPLSDHQPNHPSLTQSPFITAYGPKQKVALDFPAGFGRTKQSFKDECDINHILARFKKTGVIDFTQKNEPRYADVTGLDFEVGMQNIARANTMFQNLPSGIRSFFKNDAREFLDFVQDPDNKAECVKMGLCKAEQPAVASSAQPATPTPSARKAAPEGHGKGRKAPSQASEDDTPSDQTNSST